MTFFNGMRRLSAAAASTLALAVASGAGAEIINVSIYTNSGDFAGFQQFETMDGTYVPGQGVLYEDHGAFFTYGPASSPVDILFRSAANGGGIVYEGDPSFSLTGAQIYFGTSLPNEDYCCQQFGESGTINGGPSTNYQVFISASDPADFFAAPEPSTWALMLAGVALLGAFLRRSPLKRRLAA